jgi:Domain of Unknown Function (DUF1080)
MLSTVFLMKITPIIHFIFSVIMVSAGSVECAEPGTEPSTGEGAASSDGYTALALKDLETEGNWSVDGEGAFRLVPREGESGWKRYHHYLWLPGTFGNFSFDFEYQHPAGGNSGLYFRVSDQADPVVSGFEVQIMDSTGKADAEMGHHDLGGIIQTKGASKNMSKPPGEWNRMIVTMEGNHLTVVLNGETIQDLDLATAKKPDKELAASGKICIQDHGLPFAVRNLRVKQL